MKQEYLQPGDELRNLAAELLAPRYGLIKNEVRAIGKKVDLYFELKTFGKANKVYLEAKDYAKRLTRKQVVEIYTDYSGIIQSREPSILLLVTRNGLTTDAQAFVDLEQPLMRHQTIAELENEALGIDAYVKSLTEIFTEDGLSKYYIEAICRKIDYNNANARIVRGDEFSIFEEIQSWIIGSGYAKPIAILAGYGAGKSSLAKRIVANQATICQNDPYARRPVLVPLGRLTRYSSISGLLGGMFTDVFPVPSFNFHTFKKLNEMGKLLIVLDGFDEMKHAMSWSDFQHQISDLAKLSEGNARLIVLGRPNAFLSLDEHVHILRGMRKFGGTVRRIPDWPQFEEYELVDFNDEQIINFIRNYLTYVSESRSIFKEVSLEYRIEEVISVVSLDFELFRKPVHLKIISDLACDERVHLDKFKSGVTRWDLYECLFSDLGIREAGKEARRIVEPERRLDFLREVAYWLWTERSGATSFQASDLPSHINAMVTEVSDQIDAGLREFLTGSFLEKKDGSTFFFGHRSFAEYLVADRMVRKPPEGQVYGVYSHLLADGVSQFLNDYPDRTVFDQWIAGLADAKGLVRLEFLPFLQMQNGALDEIWRRLPEGSVMRSVAEAYIPDANRLLNDPDYDPEDGLLYRLLQLLNDPNNEIFFPVLDAIWGHLENPGSKTGGLLTSVAGKLLERVFSSASVDTDARKTYVPEKIDGARRLASQVFGRIENGIGGQTIRLDWVTLWEEVRRHQEKVDLYFKIAGAQPVLSMPRHSVFSWHDVLQSMGDSPRQNAILHFRVSSSLSDVFTKVDPARKRKV